MKLIVLFAVCLYSVNSKLPTFEDPVKYEFKVDAVYDPENPPGQKITDTEPLGFKKEVLPHPPNNGRKNPVLELTGLDQRQIEMRIETVEKGATVCVRDNDEGPDICSQGSINQCYTASKDTLRFEFYCTESCQSSDVTFYYRIVASEVEADDMWCTMRPTGGYPSDLLDGPDISKVGKPPVTPPPPKEGGGNNGGNSDGLSSGRAVVPGLMLLLAALFVALSL